MAVGAIGSAVSAAANSTDWISGAYAAINTKSSGGILGALDTASKTNNPGSIKNFLKNSQAGANAFANIAGNNLTSQSSFIAQIAAQQLQKAADAKMQKAFDDLNAAKSMVQAGNVLDPTVYFENGSYLDTTNNILTLTSGKQVDTTTGLEYVDPANRLDVGNGAWINTKTNVMTMSNGARIDIVTGLKVTT